MPRLQNKNQEDSPVRMTHLVLHVCMSIVLMFVGRSVGIGGADNYISSNCATKFHDAVAVQTSVDKARKLLDHFPNTVPLFQRLPIMILFSKGFEDNESVERIRYLKCSLKKLHEYMMPTTPTDIYIWVLKQPGNVTVVPPWVRAIPRVMVMEIEPSTWLAPCGLKNDTKWALRHRFSLDYYLMGRWRLTFSFDFVKAMGYAYNMQFDEDAVLNTKVPYNIVQAMGRTRALMAVTAAPTDEIPDVLTGLAELTKYWLVVNDFTPQGGLYKHVIPHNISGLASDSWDKMYYRGFAIITSVDYWFENNPQKFLNTVLRLGRDVEGRWQEQAVMNMMRLVFIPESRLMFLRGVDIGHNRHDHKNYYGWCVRAGFA